MLHHQPLQSPKRGNRRVVYRLLVLVLVGFTIWHWLLPALGAFLVTDSEPSSADAILVLHTGVDYYPRLIEAAQLVQDGMSMVVNSNNRPHVVQDL